MNLKEVSKEKICRTCLSQEEVLKSIFIEEQNTENEPKLHEMLTSCTSLQVSPNKRK